MPGLTAGEVSEIRVLLLDVEIEGAIAAYQGELHYDAEALEVLDARFADGVLGAWAIPEKGRLRFAGAALEGIEDAPALVLQVRAVRPPMASDFRVVLEEITAAEGFADLTSKVVTEQQPVVTSRFRNVGTR